SGGGWRRGGGAGGPPAFQGGRGGTPPPVQRNRVDFGPALGHNRGVGRSAATAPQVLGRPSMSQPPANFDPDRPRVFISYARTDGEEFAHDLRARLERGAPAVKPWGDREGVEGARGA